MWFEYQSEACKVEKGQGPLRLVRLNPRSLAQLPEGELSGLAHLRIKPLIVPGNSRVERSPA